ncbi:hypothetical protein A9Q84_16165 [Halobacteriovorax marinus]|uniref:Glycosyl transferase family 28 C-terminal domain-containing protein n=1 Tax=Halobacteriovorax marinus TaxID=97084 RepID=A0A1Y5FA03_9BACT|nr:hypothetical protein A9Q84_16165 [Halobacteriovorax marinus]
MKKKPKIIFALASAGMGHATRDVPIIQRLSKDYEVHIFCSGQANKWLGKQFDHLHQNHAIKSASVGGKISIGLVVARALLEIPKTLFYILRIAFFILWHRPKAVISDFEAHSVYAAMLVRPLFRVPIISCDHWTTIRLSERPFSFTDSEMTSLEKWQKTIKMVAPSADRYLVHGTMKTKLSDDRAKYVPTPVRDTFLQAGENISDQGPIVVSMGHLAPASLSSVLGESHHNFIIYGSDNPRIDKNVEYRAFDEVEFIKSLQSSPFVIVSANSSAIDSLAFNKPLLYVPTSGQFEQYYCGKMFESLGVAKLLTELTVESISEFSTNLESYKQKVSELDIFDNDLLCDDIRKAINEC